MAVLDHFQNIMPVLFAPAFKIFFLRISGQINKTAFAASQTGKRLFHYLSLLVFFFTGIQPLSVILDLIGNPDN
jgi:hypothetical protein